MLFKWSRGNTKLQKLATVGFGIPAYRSADGYITCPQAGVCAAICYARQGRYITPVAAAAREHNLHYIQMCLQIGGARKLAQRLCQDLRAMRKITIVRVHDSGD